ncbi:hypothetical protein [Chryseobacterium sp. 2R14A]|uniref:hypothetical protein n=1 Tax=Chryseobacterium sp. 2R14A TaxID=3380353 RepID=UPI003CE681FD
MEDNEELDPAFNAEEIPSPSDLWNYMEHYWHNNREFPESTEGLLKRKADLVDGKVPSSQLPSYVDDVQEFDSFENLPNPGEKGKIYLTVDNSSIFRWTGSEYIQLNSEIDGELIIYSVPNSSGTILTYNSNTKEVSTRTNTEIISDLSLMTTDTNQGVYAIKYFNTEPGNNWSNNKLIVYSAGVANPAMSFYKEGIDSAQLNFNGSWFSFINSDGSSYKSVVADGFSKAGSNDSYLLTGGGGHKPVSDFALATDLNNFFSNSKIQSREIGVVTTTLDSELPNGGFITSYYTDSWGGSDRPNGASYGGYIKFSKGGVDDNNLDFYYNNGHNGTDSRLWFRTKEAINSTRSWVETYHTGNFNPDSKVNKSGDTMTGSLNLNVTSNHLQFSENGVGKWHIESLGGEFNIVETGVAQRFRITPGASTPTYNNYGLWHSGNLEDYHQYGLGKINVSILSDLDTYSALSTGFYSMNLAQNAPYNYGTTIKVMRSDSEGTEIATNVFGDGLAFRGYVGGAYSTWNHVWHSGNLNPLQVGSAIQIDGTGSISNGSDTRTNKTWFDYSWAGTGYSGSVINFSGFAGGYSTELFASYGNGGTALGFRTRNGDTNTWNLHNWIWHSGNFNPDEYLPLSGGTLTGGGLIASNGNIFVQQTEVGGNATGLFWQDMPNSQFISGIGAYTENGNFYWNYLGWGASPWGTATSLAVGENIFTYKGFDVLHKGIFDPDTKVNKSGDTMTGTLSLGNGANIRINGADANWVQSYKETTGDVGIVAGFEYAHYATRWKVGNKRGGSTDSLGYAFEYSSDDGASYTSTLIISPDSNISTKQFGTASQWYQAYLWGNHASAGYTTQTWVESQDYATNNVVNEKVQQITGEFFDPAPSVYIENKFTTIIRTEEYAGVPIDIDGELIPTGNISIINLSEKPLEILRSGKYIDTVLERTTAEYYITKEQRIIRKGSYRTAELLV